MKELHKLWRHKRNGVFWDCRKESQKTPIPLGIRQITSACNLCKSFSFFATRKCCFFCVVYIYICYVYIAPKIRFRRIPPGLFPALYTSLAILSKFSLESISKPSPKELAKQDQIWELEGSDTQSRYWRRICVFGVNPEPDRDQSDDFFDCM